MAKTTEVFAIFFIVIGGVFLLFGIILYILISPLVDILQIVEHFDSENWFCAMTAIALLSSILYIIVGALFIIFGVILLLQERKPGRIRSKVREKKSSKKAQKHYEIVFPEED